MPTQTDFLLYDPIEQTLSYSVHYSSDNDPKFIGFRANTGAVRYNVIGTDTDGNFIVDGELTPVQRKLANIAAEELEENLRLYPQPCSYHAFINTEVSVELVAIERVDATLFSTR